MIVTGAASGIGRATALRILINDLPLVTVLQADAIAVPGARAARAGLHALTSP